MTVIYSGLAGLGVATGNQSGQGNFLGLTNNAPTVTGTPATVTFEVILPSPPIVPLPNKITIDPGDGNSPVILNGPFTTNPIQVDISYPSPENGPFIPKVEYEFPDGSKFNKDLPSINIGNQTLPVTVPTVAITGSGSAEIKTVELSGGDTLTMDFSFIQFAASDGSTEFNPNGVRDDANGIGQISVRREPLFSWAIPRELDLTYRNGNGWSLDVTTISGTTTQSLGAVVETLNFSDVTSFKLTNASTNGGGNILIIRNLELSD